MLLLLRAAAASVAGLAAYRPLPAADRAHPGADPDLSASADCNVLPDRHAGRCGGEQRPTGPVAAMLPAIDRPLGELVFSSGFEAGWPTVARRAQVSLNGGYVFASHRMP